MTTAEPNPHEMTNDDRVKIATIPATVMDPRIKALYNTSMEVYDRGLYDRSQWIEGEYNFGPGTGWNIKNSMPEWEFRQTVNRILAASGGVKPMVTKPLAQKIAEEQKAAAEWDKPKNSISSGVNGGTGANSTTFEKSVEIDRQRGQIISKARDSGASPETIDYLVAEFNKNNPTPTPVKTSPMTRTQPIILTSAELERYLSPARTPNGICPDNFSKAQPLQYLLDNYPKLKEALGVSINGEIPDKLKELGLDNFSSVSDLTRKLQSTGQIIVAEDKKKMSFDLTPGFNLGVSSALGTALAGAQASLGSILNGTGTQFKSDVESIDLTPGFNLGISDGTLGSALGQGLVSGAKASIMPPGYQLPQNSLVPYLVLAGAILLMKK